MTAPSLARILTDAGAFASEPFTLVDVGCSGGIFNPALQFTPALRAVGFDPIIDEVERLQASTPADGVQFECALVGDPEWTPLPPRGTPGVFARSSAAAYGDIHGFDYGEQINNQGRKITLTDRMVRLADWLADEPEWVVDLLKVDTDGSDISVVRSLGDRLGEPLAVHIEVQFDGETGPDRNVFSTVFDTLVSAGYRLFSLEPSRYSKAALPRPFQWRMPAQTVYGQVMQADALFCRDLAVEGNDSPTRILKMACIFDLLDLQDCAAELIEARAETLAPSVPCDIEELLAAVGRRTELGLAPKDARNLLATDPGRFLPGPQGDVPPNDVLSVNRWPALAADDEPIRIGTPSDVLAGAAAHGWWPPEPTGAWTAGPAATLNIALPDGLRTGDVVEIETWRLEPPEDAQPALAIVINGVALTEVDAQPGHQAFRVPMPIASGPASITIHAWPLVTPADASGSADRRALGLHVSSIALRRNDADSA